MVDRATRDSLSLSLFLYRSPLTIGEALEENRAESTSDKFDGFGGKRRRGKEEQNELDSSNESRPWMTSLLAVEEHGACRWQGSPYFRRTISGRTPTYISIRQTVHTPYRATQSTLSSSNCDRCSSGELGIAPQKSSSHATRKISPLEIERGGGVRTDEYRDE